MIKEAKKAWTSKDEAFRTWRKAIEDLGISVFSLRMPPPECHGSAPTIVFEPTGLTWISLAVYLRARHLKSQLVKARLQKVAALRRYLRSRTKSDRVDGMTLAKMPFIDSEQLDEAYLPPAKYFYVDCCRYFSKRN